MTFSWIKQSATEPALVKWSMAKMGIRIWQLYFTTIFHDDLIGSSIHIP